MADYFAVLNRTLSGFTNPKPQLREKLYERARATIERQLRMKTPAPDAETLQSEMQRLEEAIGDIERRYNPDYINASAAAATVAVVSQPEPNPVVTPQAVPESIPEQEPMPAPEPEPEPVVEVKQPVEPELLPELEPEIPATMETPIEHAVVPEPAPVPIVEEASAPELPVADVPNLDPVFDTSVEPVATAEPDPLDAWADEFLSNDPSTVNTPHVASATSVEPGSEIPSFDEYAAEELTIPPAAAAVATPKPKKGFGKWLLMLLILLLLGTAGYFGWANKDSLIDRFGLSAYLDDPTRPKPVKTIAITPEPEEPEIEVEPETTSEPKSETRLTESGEEVTSEPAVTIAPTVEETPTQPIERANAGDAPVVSQSAILYEEGSTRDQNSIDSGRVVWSVIQESTGNGDETSPAIRARVEIPERSAVLIMTIKRNGDKALPASHLIELIFAVPDNFSGGAIDAINRYVLKENEQGQGEALVGVPARIADGIFLIALNTLDNAKKKNTTLLRERDWIDIPMQYRTGRRALMTIEKGVPGEKVFKEVFEAWDKLDAS